MTRVIHKLPEHRRDGHSEFDGSLVERSVFLVRDSNANPTPPGLAMWKRPESLEGVTQSCLGARFGRHGVSREVSTRGSACAHATDDRQRERSGSPGSEFSGDCGSESPF